MALFLKNKLFLNSLFVVSGIVWGLALTCENAPTNQGKEGVGGIYGALQIKSINHYAEWLSPTLAVVLIEGTELFAKPDSARIFYFPEVKPGKYNLIGKAPGFADYIVEGVEVQEDSISFVSMFSLLKQSFPEKRNWDGIKIKSIDVRRKGSMAGKINDMGTGDFIVAANVSIKGTFFGGVSDFAGNFVSKHILPGRYTAFGSIPGYHITLIYNIRIAPDSVSIVNFRLRGNLIPEEPLPWEWEPQFIKEP